MEWITFKTSSNRIFMIDGKTKLNEYIKYWKRYVDDTVCVVKIDTVTQVIFSTDEL